ncbi:MAG TPA: hypothetical protein VLT59_15190, partial [Steroidobacteraceae bacterium]|nr:hypothetical protein [Steroidobacteraceae bacterium]
MTVGEAVVVAVGFSAGLVVALSGEKSEPVAAADPDSEYVWVEESEAIRLAEEEEQSLEGMIKRIVLEVKMEDEADPYVAVMRRAGMPPLPHGTYRMPERRLTPDGRIVIPRRRR